MLHAIVAIRRVLAMGMAAAIGTWGLQVHPVDLADPFLGLIEARSPGVFATLVYGYVVLWFTTPFFGASSFSLFAILASRREPRVRARPLPSTRNQRIAQPRHSCSVSVISRPRQDDPPSRLADDSQAGLYTGVMVVGAVGTGKTSACMYPYADQLLRWRSGDPDHKVGGLVLEVKGDFCNQVRGILRQAGRENDYLEIGLDSGVAYNPLHNDLEPYALAYAIASLLNNLFGKSKEPFWQQAYTDLLKFVILLRRITEGYTTLCGGVPLRPRRISRSSRTSRTLKAQFKDPPTCIVVSATDYRADVRQLPWTLWFRGERAANVRTRTHAELEAYLSRHSIPAACEDQRRSALDRPTPPASRRLHRWYKHGWSRLDNRLRSSITEGVVVFLSLFDDNPAGPRHVLSAALGVRRRRRAGSERVPCRPLEELLETGTRPCAEFPGRDESGSGTCTGRDAEARFSARRAEADSEDRGRSGRSVARPGVRLRRVSRLRHGGRNRPDRRRADVRAVPAGAADPDRRDAEHQLPAIGAARATRAGAR